MSHLVEVFYAEHCLSCPEARKVVRRLAVDRTDIVVLEHDVGNSLELAARYHLIATPALVIDRRAVMYGVPRLEALAARVNSSRPAAEV